MPGATRHTAIIGDAVGMWSKLAWDVDVFRDIQVCYPDEDQPLAYAAINVCIAAASLRDWVKAALEAEAKKAGKIWRNEAFYRSVDAAIPELLSCVAIANTAKHANFRERGWIDGEVVMAYEEGDEDVPPGYVLYHMVAGRQSLGFAVSRFDALCRNWWAFLVANGLDDGQAKMPRWRTNKLNRIFGHHRMTPPS